ncbi:lipase family protein [Morganella morganii]|uniref:lipase family protein n=1 Tax=Morganella morganii TaxID=582 RepID=UPI001FFC3E8A|nr:lipase family protein [Morganella morganii]
MKLRICANISGHRIPPPRFFYQQCFDLSQTPVLKDSFNYPAIVTDVPFRERYSPAVFLDASQSKRYEKGDHDTKMFFVENASQIIVAWRGTASKRSVLTDATYQPISCPAELVPGGKSKVHRGFLEAYQCIGKYFREKINKLSTTTKRKELFITGHSLGGTMGLLQAAALWDYCRRQHYGITAGGSTER